MWNKTKSMEELRDELANRIKVHTRQIASLNSDRRKVEDQLGDIDQNISDNADDIFALTQAVIALEALIKLEAKHGEKL